MTRSQNSKKMTTEVRRRGMVRRRAGELPLEPVETANLVLLSRGRSVLRQELLLGSFLISHATEPMLGSPLIANLRWKYSMFLGSMLALFLCYLILPKGFRFQYCRSQRRRYRKSSVTVTRKDIQTWINAANAAKTKAEGTNVNENMSLRGALQKRRSLVQGILDTRSEQGTRQRNETPLHRQPSPVAPSTMGGQLAQSPRKRTNVTFDSPSGYRSMMSKGSQSSFAGGDDKYASSGKLSLASTMEQDTTYTPKSWNISTPEAPPSPKHPAISTMPTEDIVNETMDRLKGRGIRLIAHGVQCETKRVWIRLDEDTTSVTWQTEFPRRVPTVNGDVSIVLMRGSLHKIALPNVLYIDVGKKTTALKKPQNRHVVDSLCFSLLTQNGSLDLQTNSSLERDALVSCFSMVLDQIHTQDWRKLYEESPPPSQATSSQASSGPLIRSDFVEV